MDWISPGQESALFLQEDGYTLYILKCYNFSESWLVVYKEPLRFRQQNLVLYSGNSHALLGDNVSSRRRHSATRTELEQWENYAWSTHYTMQDQKETRWFSFASWPNRYNHPSK